MSKIFSVCLIFVLCVFTISSAQDQKEKPDLEKKITTAIQTMNKAIEEKNDPMRNKMYFELRLIEQDNPGSVAPFLIQNLSSTQPGVPEYSAYVLGWINDKRAINPLRNMLKGSREFKIHAARALGFMRATEAREDIVLLLKDPDNRVRQDAAYALGLMGDEKAIKALKEAENDSDEIVRFFASEAIKRIENYKKYGW